MRVFLSFCLSIILLVIFVPYSLASEEETEGPVQERLHDLRERRNATIENFERRLDELRQKRDDLRERVATRQAQNRQNVVSRIKTVFGNILSRFDAAMARLDKLADRIASRIDKLKERGVDTSIAEAKLAEAEKAGLAANSAINNAKLAVEAIDASSVSVKDAVHAATPAVKDAKKALFDYHKALVAVLRELKAAASLREGTNGASE